MMQPNISTPGDSELDAPSTEQNIRAILRLLLALRYRKNLVATVMVSTALVGALYYVVTPRKYAAKAVLLITQSRPDRLDTSITNEESQRQNAMPTFENMVCSAKVLEGAAKALSPEDRTAIDATTIESAVGALRSVSAKTVRSTSIMEVGYCAKNPKVAVRVVQAVVQSYLEFMDRIHKGTAGEISRMLTREREELAEKLANKQKELLNARRDFADMGFRSDGKSLHPMVQRAVYFNDALIAAQKRRVECDALVAGIEAAVAKGEDLGQYLMAVGNDVGREMLLNNLGLGSRDVNTQANLEQELIADRAQLESIQRHFGPNHPEVVTLSQRIRFISQYLESTSSRIDRRVADLGKSQLGPWLIQMVRQKRDEAKKEEEMLQARFEESRAEAISLSGQVAKVEMLERDVKRLGDMNDVLLNQIASLDLRQNGQDVRVAVIEEPVASSSPVSPKLNMTIVAVLLGGLGLSFGLVTLLDLLDDRFRSVDELEGRVGLPVLAMIQRLEMSETVGPKALVTFVSPTSAAAEGFRTLRTALTLTNADAKQFVVTSAEPGDGKTTTLANLAVCYAQAGKRTLLIDADLRRPGMTKLMDMRGPHGLSEVLRSTDEIGENARFHIQHSAVPGLDVLPCGPRPSDPSELLSGPRLSQLLAWAEATYDMILVDSPPTLAATDTAIIGRLVDGVILVVQPAKNRRRLILRVVERLNLMKVNVLGMTINRAGTGQDEGYYEYNHYGYGEGYGVEYHDEPETPLPVNAASAERASRFDDDDEELSDGRPLRVPRRAA